MPTAIFDVCFTPESGHLQQSECPLCIVGDGGDVNQSLYAVIHSRGCDRGSAVRVTYEDGGAANPPQRAFHCGHVLRECIEAILDGDHLVPVGL
jgi:hypothetical protein